MSAFTTPLELEYLDGRNWRVTAEFDFASSVLERIIRVPVGFVTDFASIPRLLWNILPPTGLYGKAALLHDDAYRNPEMLSPPITRQQADRLLWEGMEVLGVSYHVKLIIYLGVRFGGRRTWDGYRQAK